MGRKSLNDLAGEEFEHLKAVEISHVCNKTTFWKCLCTLCGNYTVVQRSNLVSGNSSSCGCRKGKNILIAELAGCAPSAVSAILRNKYRGATCATRKKTDKIKALAKELNHTPWYNLNT